MKFMIFELETNYLFSVDGEVNKDIHETRWIFNPKIWILNMNNISYIMGSRKYLFVWKYYPKY